ncbi:unnamed protein product [Cochlearia groenlandica]
MGGQGGCNANAGVPASSRNVVQSLKEMMIVNFSDSEIYAMLVECDMDPDQTVDRLLSQDTFHEVKSKKAKKKVTKESAESRAAPSIPNRGAGNIGNDSSRGGGGGNRFNSNGKGSVQGVRAHKSENGTRNHCAGSSSSTLGVLGRQPLTNSEVKKAPTVSNDVVASLPLPSPPNQSAWVSAKPGQRTMADIIKMSMQPLPQKNNGSPRSSETQENDGSKSPLKDEWPSIEKQDGSSEAKTSCTDQFREPQHLVETCFDDEENPEGKTSTFMSPPDADLVVPPSSVSSRNLVDDDLTDSSLYDVESNKAESDAFDENGGEDVSESVATGFQQLAIEDQEENKRILIIPKHLQAHTSECSHIMFGTYSPGLGSSQASGLNGNDLEETQETEDNSSFRHPDTEFYGDEEEDQLRNGAIDEQGSYQMDSAPRNYHPSSESETEDEQREPLQEDHHQYKFSSSVGYGFENSQPLIPQAQNLDSVMHENSQAWHQGQEPNARMVLGNGYYSLPAHQNQQVPDFRHAQQLQQQQQQMSQQQQHYGGHGYAAISLDHLRLQQQNGRDATKQNQHKFWPNNY